MSLRAASRVNCLPWKENRPAPLEALRMVRLGADWPREWDEGGGRHHCELGPLCGVARRHRAPNRPFR